MLIKERKVRLDGSEETFLCERLLLEPGRRAILRYRVDREWRVADGALVVPQGAENLAYYWADRPYNVYRFQSGGKTLALYCNVAQPLAIREDLVEYLDLTVDVLIRPSGEALVLDEEELPPDLEPAHRKRIAQAVETLTSAPRRLLAELGAEAR